MTLSSNSDEVVFKAGEKDFQKKNWDAARKHYKRIVDGFPQSEHLPDARLGLAEAHFQEGGTANYILAVAEYREFLTLYPSHPKSDYAQYQTAEAYFRQKNSPDRDQTSTVKALEEYDRLLDIYPSSPYVEPARARIAVLRQYLARAEFAAGFFYQKTRKALRSAILRYEEILADYPDYSGTDEVLLHLAECMVAAGRQPEALPRLSRLMTEYPKSQFLKRAQLLIDTLAKAGVVAPPEAPHDSAPAGPPPEKPTP